MKEPPSIASIIRTTLLCLILSGIILRLAASHNFVGQIADGLLLVAGFLLLSWYGLKQINNDLR